MFPGMCAFVVHIDQKPHQVWKNHLHQTLLADGISDLRVLQECLAIAQDRGMVGNISSWSWPTTVDGPLDVLTSVIFSMWGSILDTFFQATKSVISYAPVLAIRQFEGKAIHPSLRRISLTRIRVWLTGASSLLNQIMLTWKDPHKMRLGQIVGGCTPEYTIWRR